MARTHTYVLSEPSEKEPLTIGDLLDHQYEGMFFEYVDYEGEYCIGQIVQADYGIIIPIGAAGNRLISVRDVNSIRDVEGPCTVKPHVHTGSQAVTEYPVTRVFTAEIKLTEIPLNEVRRVNLTNREQYLYE